MPDYEKLLQASLPEALDAAVDSINFAYENADALLEAEVSLIEDLNYTVFAYFNRDDVFYVNKAGRRLLQIRDCLTETTRSKPAPIFWLEESSDRLVDDRDVIESCRPKHHVNELITLSWGKTWLRGSKYPIRSTMGMPLAILFAGREMAGSEQIRRVVTRFQRSHNEFGDN